MKKISFIICVYNSENTIDELVNRIISMMLMLKHKYSFEIILINDGSYDKSNEKCMELSRKYSFIKFIDLCKNFGQACAQMAGFRAVDGDYIINMDDDLQTVPEEIDKLINKLENGKFDIVYAKYENQEKSLFRKFGSRVDQWMSEKLILKPKNIRTESFFITRKYIIDEIIKYNGPYPYISGLVFRITNNVGDVVIKHEKRKFGKSNYTLKKLLKLWLNGATNFSVKPLRISSLVGFVSSLVGLIYLIYIVIRKVVFNNLQSGWTSLIATIIFFGGMQLLSIGILGEYIGRIFICINKSPQYVIKNTYGLNEDDQKNVNEVFKVN